MSGTGDPSRAELLAELEDLRRRVGELEEGTGETTLRATEREEELQRTQFVVDRSADAAFWMGPDARFFFVNEAACRSLGYSREELLELTVHDIDPGFPTEAWPAHWEEIRNRKSVTIESRHRRRDGTEFPVEIIANHVEFGGREYNCAFARDITERLRVEQALSESEEQLRTVVQAAFEAMIAIDGEGRITFFNRAAEELFGREAAEVVGGDLDILMPEEYRDRHRGYVESYFRTGKPDGAIGRRVELPAVRKDGTVFPMEISLARGEAADRAFVIGVARDISSRKAEEAERIRMEERLRQSQKLESLAALAGGIAHDFNNLLTAVLGHASMASARLIEGSPVQASLREIEKAARRATDLSTQMLAYSGRGHFLIEPIDLSSLIRGMADLFEGAAPEGASLELDLPEGLPCVDADGAQLRQLVMNLVTNAAEALSEEAGRIRVATGARDCNRAYLARTFLEEGLEEGGYVFIEIADSGCGMDEATLDRVFDPFFSTKFTGRGLGMAAVLGIVRGHRGAIRIESTPGAGTTVQVLFPASRVEAPRPADTLPDRPHRSAPATILVVDDEEAVLGVAEAILTEEGHRVLLADSGPSAAEILSDRGDEISCVLLDLTMPGMDGVATFARLREIDPEVRVVLTSGYSERDATERFEGEGLAGFIQKPYTPTELVSRLEAVLAG